jgi:hypothetical protein
MCITCDNASNNQTMVKYIAKKLDIEFEYEEIFVGCFAHVLNLAMQEIFQKLGAGTFGETKKLLDTDEEHDYLTALFHVSPIQKVLIQFHSILFIYFLNID